MTHKKLFTYLLRFLLGLTVLAGLYYMQKELTADGGLTEIASWGGYAGVLAFSFVNCFNFFVPLVTPTLTPTWVAAGLHPVVVVACMVAMITLVDLGFYLLGRYSRKFTHKHKSQKIIAKIRTLRDRSYFLPLAFMLAWLLFVPLSNEPVTIAIGILGYRILPVAGVLLIGNTVYNGVIAYLALVAVG